MILIFDEAFPLGVFDWTEPQHSDQAESEAVAPALDAESSVPDYDKIDSDGVFLRDQTEIWMKKYWGEKCPDFDGGCIGCQAWKAFETVFADLPEKLQ